MNAVPAWFHEHLVKLLPDDAEMLQKLSGMIGCIAEEFHANRFDIIVVANVYRTFYMVNPDRGDLRTTDAVKRNVKYIRSFCFLIILAITPDIADQEPYTSLGFNNHPMCGGISISWDDVVDLSAFFFHSTKRILHLAPVAEILVNEETMRQSMLQASRVVERSRRFLVGAEELVLDFVDDTSACSVALKELFVEHCHNGTLRSLHISRNLQWTPVLFNALVTFVFGPISRSLTTCGGQDYENENISNDFMADLLAVWANFERADIPTRKRFYGFKFPMRIFRNFTFRRLEDKRIVETEWVMEQRKLMNELENGVNNRFYVTNHPKCPERFVVAHFTLSLLNLPLFDPMPLSDQFEALCDSGKPPYLVSLFSLYFL